jgi:hypothetical protein
MISLLLSFCGESILPYAITGVLIGIAMFVTGFILDYGGERECPPPLIPPEIHAAVIARISNNPPRQVDAPAIEPTRHTPVIETTRSRDLRYIEEA